MSRILTIVAILVGTLVIVGRQLPEVATPGPISTTSRSTPSPATQHSSPNERVSGHRGRIPRSREARAQFMAETPCPATGRPSKHCPGYIVDHICALAIGGADAPSNMQYQTKADAVEKDRWELDRNDPRNVGCW